MLGRPTPDVCLTGGATVKQSHTSSSSSTGADASNGSFS